MGARKRAKKEARELAGLFRARFEALSGAQEWAGDGTSGGVDPRGAQPGPVLEGELLPAPRREDFAETGRRIAKMLEAV